MRVCMWGKFDDLGVSSRSDCIVLLCVCVCGKNSTISGFLLEATATAPPPPRGCSKVNGIVYSSLLKEHDTHFQSLLIEYNSVYIVFETSVQPLCTLKLLYVLHQAALLYVQGNIYPFKVFDSILYRRGTYAGDMDCERTVLPREPPPGAERPEYAIASQDATSLGG